jgi:hypothetical protein
VRAAVAAQNGSVTYATKYGLRNSMTGILGYHDMENHRIKRKLNADSADPATPTTATATVLALVGSAAMQLFAVTAAPNTRVTPASDLVAFAAQRPPRR